MKFTQGVGVVKCPHCGYSNPDDQVLCLQCSLPLQPPEAQPAAPETSKRDTGVFDATTSGPGVLHWGTASLGAEHKLLLHVRGYDAPLVASLGDPLVVGRCDPETGQKPDLDLDPYAATEMGVSRRHAVIFVEDDGVKIVDLGSANYTYINGQRLVAHQARILRDGDELRLGRLIIRVGFA